MKALAAAVPLVVAICVLSSLSAVRAEAVTDTEGDSHLPELEIPRIVGRPRFAQRGIWSSIKTGFQRVMNGVQKFGTNVMGKVSTFATKVAAGAKQLLGGLKLGGAAPPSAAKTASASAKAASAAAVVAAASKQSSLGPPPVVASSHSASESAGEHAAEEPDVEIGGCADNEGEEAIALYEELKKYRTVAEGDDTPPPNCRCGRCAEFFKRIARIQAAYPSLDSLRVVAKVLPEKLDPELAEAVEEQAEKEAECREARMEGRTCAGMSLTTFVEVVDDITCDHKEFFRHCETDECKARAKRLGCHIATVKPDWSDVFSRTIAPEIVKEKHACTPQRRFNTCCASPTQMCCSGTCAKAVIDDTL